MPKRGQTEKGDSERTPHSVYNHEALGLEALSVSFLMVCVCVYVCSCPPYSTFWKATGRRSIFRRYSRFQTADSVCNLVGDCTVCWLILFASGKDFNLALADDTSASFCILTLLLLYHSKQHLSFFYRGGGG